MNRVWDYIRFAVWFAGLGYIIMWLLSSPDLLLLPPALHAVGIASAILVPVLLSRAVGRRRAAASAAEAVSAPTPAAIPQPPLRNSARPLRSVKPRSHFGLRGTPD